MNPAWMENAVFGLPQAAFWALAGVYLILVVASLITWRLVAAQPGERWRELIDRVKSWWVIVGAFTVTVMIGQGAAIIFLAFISFLALKEFLSLIPTRRVDRPVLFFVYLTVPIQFTLAYIDYYNLFIVFIPVWAYLFITMTMVLIGNTQGFLAAVGTVSWGLMITVFALSHMAYLIASGDEANSVAGGAGLLFFLIFMTQANDVAQYVWGRLLGRHKIVPSVSPNKTWEGFLGGLATTALLSGVAGPLLTEMDFFWSLAAGAMLAVVGFVGDVTLSAFKRDLGVKDTSNFIPGHGGVLDRVDSLTYAAPVFVHAYRFFFYP